MASLQPSPREQGTPLGAPLAPAAKEETFTLPLAAGSSTTFQLKISRIEKFVFSVEILDGTSSWYRATNLPPEAQGRIRQIAKFLRASADPAQVSIPKLKNLLREVLTGVDTVNLFEETLKTLAAGRAPEVPIPATLQCTLFEELQGECAVDIWLKSTRHLLAMGPEIVAHLRDEDERDALRTLIGSIGTVEPVLLGALPEVPLRIGKALADAAIWSGKYHVDLDKEAFLSLTARLEHFGSEGGRSLRNFMTSRVVGYSEWGLYFEYLRALPESLRYTYEDVYGHLERIPEYLTTKRPHRILAHLDLFPAEQHAAIVEEMIREGNETDFRQIPDRIWQKLDQKRIAALLAERHGPGVIRDNLGHFTDLPPGVAVKWWQGREQRLVLDNLGSFRELPSWIAFEGATKFGELGRVLGNAGSFQWKPGDFSRLVEAHATDRLGSLLENLDVIPPRLLQEVEDSYHLMEYRDRLGMPSSRVYEIFRRIKTGGDSLELERFVRQVGDFSKRIVSSEQHTEKFFGHPLYDDLVDALYPGHGTSVGGFDPVPFAQLQHQASRSQGRPILRVDRTADLAAFTFDEKYVIDLSESVTMVLKDGKSLDSQSIEQLQAPLQEARDALVEGVKQGKRADIVLEELFYGAGKAQDGKRSSEIERKVADQLLAALVGDLPFAEARESLLRYHVLTSAHEHEYLQGTRDRASRSRNRDYAYLLLMREYFADRLADTCNRLTESVLRSERFRSTLPQIHERLQQRQAEEARRTVMARSKLSSRGFTEGFAASLLKVFSNPELTTEKKYEITARIVAGEQRKIAAVLEELTGAQIDATTIHLGSFDAQAVTTSLDHKVLPQLEEHSFRAFTKQCFLAFLNQDVRFIDTEIGKYQPERGSSGRALRVEAFFTKNHASVYARRVGGVCVANDWGGGAARHGLLMAPFAVGGAHLAPSKRRETQWDLPNYFQLVLRNAATLRCEGVILLHHYQVGKKRILVGSFNPSSTYLFKVNERELFRGLLDVLIAFAQQNNFDMVGCSRNPGIRTNRSGGAFELALNEQIKRVGKEFRLPAPATFSYRPLYTQQEFDILWERKDHENGVELQGT